MSNTMDEVKPFWFCRLIVNHHVAAFAIAVVAQTSFVLITVFLHLLGSDVLPVDFTDVPLILEYEPSYRRVAAWNLRNTDPQEPIVRNPSFVSTEDVEQQLIFRQHLADVVELYYETTDSSNILTYNFLKTIAKFERILLDMPLYEKFCVLDDNSQCKVVDSITQFFPYYFINNSEYVDELEANRNISKTLIDFANENETMRRLVKDFLNVDAIIEGQARSTGLRSYLLASWTSYNKTKYPKLPADTKEYGSLVMGPAFWNYSFNGIPHSEHLPLKFFYYNAFLYYDRLSYECSHDQMLAIGSFLFIFCFLWFQTRSLFIATFGMYSILTNFCGANLIYRYIFDFRYFGVFNALAIFLILAIGVDEIFVFEETWTSSKDQSFSSLAHRLSTCYKKCSLSIFIPTVTTAASLVQNAMCPLLALSSFGLFAFNLVVLNYLSIITYLPCVLIFYHHHFETNCVSAKNRLNDAMSNNKVVDSTEPPNQQADNRIDKKKFQRLSHKCCNWYFQLIWSRKTQTVILSLTLAILLFFFYQSTQIQTDETPPRLFVGNHLLGISLQKRKTEFNVTKYFANANDFIRIYLVWGISDLDRSGCHKTNWTHCRGKVVWNDNFDLNSYQTQKDLLEICHRFKTANNELKQTLRMKTAADGSVEIDCFIEQMDKYFNDELRSIFHSERKSAGLPASDVKVEALMLHVPQIFNMDNLLNNSFFSRYFEIANLYWLNDGYKFVFPLYAYPPSSMMEQLKAHPSLSGLMPLPQPVTPPLFTTEHYRQYSNLIGHSKNSPDLQESTLGNYTFIYGTKLRYAAIIINTTIPIINLRYQEGIAVLDKWEHYFNQMIANLSFPLRHGIIATPDSNNDLGGGIWHWMKVQEMMIFTAWQGIVIGLCLALPILVLFIDDLLLGALATLMIGFVSVCIIGIIPLVGWKLGLLESLNITLVADLAIDHIVHIAEGYQLSTKRKRKEKVEELLRDIGISVLSGAITTLGASSFLFFANIVFFLQFGLFIFFTVAFSMLFALATFIVLLAMIGPEDDQYSLRRLVRKLMFKCSPLFRYLHTFSQSLDKKAELGDSVLLPHSGTASHLRQANVTSMSVPPTTEVVSDPSLVHINSCSSSSVLNAVSSNRMITARSGNRLETFKSIDDDNLSSGYETNSVKNQAIESVSETSDNEETAKKVKKQPTLLAVKIATIPEEMSLESVNSRRRSIETNSIITPGSAKHRPLFFIQR